MNLLRSFLEALGLRSHSTRPQTSPASGTFTFRRSTFGSSPECRDGPEWCGINRSIGPERGLIVTGDVASQADKPSGVLLT